MHPEEMKAKIRMAGMTATMIAEELDIHVSSVSHVISGRGRSARVEQRIAELIKEPVDKVFPPKMSVLRRTKAQIRNTAHANHARKSA